MNTAVLVVSVDDKVVAEYPIDKDKITIGRKPDNDICLNNLAISGYHSQIVTVLDSSFLEDLNSTNGTFVNSRLIKKHALENGDSIDIGNHRLRFMGSTEEEEEAEEEFPIDDEILEQTIILSPDELNLSLGKPNGASNNAAPEPQQAPAEPAADATPDDSEQTGKYVESEHFIQRPSGVKIGKLQILNGKNAGHELELVKSLTTFGSPKTSIAGITKRRNGHFLIQVLGKDGHVTLLNGESTPSKAVSLEEHDIIEVAGVKLEFFIE